MDETTTSRPRLAFLCDRLGPYHVARLRAASRRARVTAIEFSSKDTTYAWDPIPSIDAFAREILFEDEPLGGQPGRVVQSRVRRLLRDIGPDVVAIPGWDAAPSLAALAWCLETRTPTVLMSDSQAQDEARKRWKESIKRRVVRLHSAGFVGGSPHRDYLASLGLAEERIVPGVDVVDNDHFRTGAEHARAGERALRERLGLPDRYFLVPGRFVRKKNLATVLEAYALYRRGRPDRPWNLVLLGDGPLRDEIAELTRTLHVEGSVLLAGFRQYPDLPAFYGLAGAMILASTSEPWGLVVNEAMAAGLPVIVSSRCGSAPDLVEDGVNGFAFDPENARALADRLARIAGDDGERLRMGMASLRKIDSWGLDLFASNLMAACELARRAPPIRASLPDRLLLQALVLRRRARAPVVVTT